MTKQIFVNCSKKDGEFIYILSENLKAKEYPAWIDQEISGGEIWHVAIEQNLREAGE